MAKKNRGKKVAAYKPAPMRPAVESSMQKLASEPTKRAKKSADLGSEDSEEIDRRSKVNSKITDEMFEAAKLMKNGVSHMKDLDLSVVKREQSLNQKVGSCEVTMIDIVTGEVKMAKVQKPLDKAHARFDFNSEVDFNPDADALQVAKKAWNWLLNPISFDDFASTIKDKKILII